MKSTELLYFAYYTAHIRYDQTVMIVGPNRVMVDEYRRVIREMAERDYGDTLVRNNSHCIVLPNNATIRFDIASSRTGRGMGISTLIFLNFRDWKPKVRGDLFHSLYPTLAPLHRAFVTDEDTAPDFLNLLRGD